MTWKWDNWARKNNFYNLAMKLFDKISHFDKTCLVFKVALIRFSLSRDIKAFLVAWLQGPRQQEHLICLGQSLLITDSNARLLEAASMFKYLVWEKKLSGTKFFDQSWTFKSTILNRTLNFEELSLRKICGKAEIRNSSRSNLF